MNPCPANDLAATTPTIAARRRIQLPPTPSQNQPNAIGTPEDDSYPSFPFHPASDKGRNNKDGDGICTEIASTIEKYQAIYLQQWYRSNDDQSNGTNQTPTNALHWKDLHKSYPALGDSDNESFCIEQSVTGNNDDDGDAVEQKKKGTAFLSGDPSAAVGYTFLSCMRMFIMPIKFPPCFYEYPLRIASITC